MAPGCPEQFDLGFLKWVWNYRRDQRPGLVSFLGRLRPDQHLVTFTTRRQADGYLAGLASRKDFLKAFQRVAIAVVELLENAPHGLVIQITQINLRLWHL